MTTLSAQVVSVTPDEATRIRLTCKFDRQRSVNQDHVNRLAIEMKLGWFLAGTPIWLCETPDGKQFLVNGQHTLEAIRAANVPVTLTIITQRVAKIDDVGKSYVCFDIQRSRTWMQSAVAVGLHDELPLLPQALSGATYILSEFRDRTKMNESTRTSRQARLDLLKTYQTPLTVLKAAIGLGPIENRNLIYRAGVFAVAMETAREQPSTAEEFWGGMVMDDGLKANDPRKVLLRYLANTTVRKAGHDMVICAAMAWNAYFEDRVMDRLIPGAMKTFRIAGTKWDENDKRRVVLRKSRTVASSQVAAP